MADARKPQPTALAAAATDLAARARTGHFLSPRGYRILGITLVVLLAGGIWYYLTRAGRLAASRQWAALAQPDADLADYAANNPDTLAGKVARLQQARTLLGPQGIATLGGDSREARVKGIENIAQARDQFVTLAAEFDRDKTLKATCLAAAAEAELALVGIPQDANPAEFRGTVAGAVGHLNQAAGVAGQETAAGQAFLARAKELEATAAQVLAAGRELNDRYKLLTPFPAPAGFGPVTPANPALNPPGPIAPPAFTPPALAPTPPAGPVTPPTTPPAPTPATPTTQK